MLVLKLDDNLQALLKDYFSRYDLNRNGDPPFSQTVLHPTRDSCTGVIDSIEELEQVQR